MEYSEHVETIEPNVTLLADAAQRAGVDAPVPTCPEWVVGDLLTHLGRVHRWVTDIVRSRATEMTERPAGDPPDGPDRIRWVVDGAGALADALRATEPDTPMWAFGEPPSARFWARRQAHELAMHRVDAELAAGAATPIESAFAADGIDEFLMLLQLVSRRGDRRRGITGSGETIHVHCTDVDGEWLVRLEPDVPVVTREHAKGDVAVRGSASDLLLLLSGRLTRDAPNFEVFGEATLLDWWRSEVRF